MKKALCLLFSLSFLAANAQKMVWEKGKETTFLKGETQLEVEYNYEEMLCGRKAIPVKEYVNEKVTEYNQKEAGKGDDYGRKFEEAKTKEYKTKFELSMNKQLSKYNIKVGEDQKEGKFKLILSTTRWFPGYNVGVSSQDAYCDFKITIVDKSTGTEYALLTMKNVPGAVLKGVPGMGGMMSLAVDHDTFKRVGEAYAKAGKSLGGHIAKYVK